MGSAEGRIVVLSAPSGAGKTTIANHLVQELPLRFATSATTRNPRPDETRGEDYYFYTEEDFHRLIDNDELLEYEEVHGTYYGTLKEEVEEIDAPVLLDIDVNGAQTIKDVHGENVLLLFIAPPSISELRHRLKKRGADTEAEIERRLDRAEHELSFQDTYDHVIVNDDRQTAQEEAVKTVSAWLRKETY